MTTLTDDQLANLKPILKSVEELRSDLAYLIERDARLQARWILGLTISNGAALTALGARVIDLLSQPSTEQAKDALAIAIPSLWMFLGGILLAGTAALMELVSNQKIMWRLHQSIRFRLTHPEAITKNELSPISWRAWMVEILSGLSFAGGLAYPLLVLAFRYFAADGVTW